mgnify:CR=1 FL=1
MRSSVSFVVAALLATTVSSNCVASQDDKKLLDWFAQGQHTLAALKQQGGAGRAKNVILFVGDGMGISTVTAARILEGQQRGVDGEGNRLAFEQLPHLALSVTASANQQTPDSAPTATAMVTGIKTNAGALSVKGSLPRSANQAEVVEQAAVMTLLEQAEQVGMATGIVTTARVTHATPAANYAHTPERNWEADSDLPAGASVKDIARQLLESPYGDGPEVVLGGGRRAFYSAHYEDPEYPGLYGGRTDGRNLHEEWLASADKAHYVWNRGQLQAVDLNQTGRLLGLFEPSHMHYEVDRSSDAAGEPSLADMTAAALAVLERNAQGFYLMVEAGRIDHGHHAGNAYRALHETIQLSEAVKVALANTDRRETLIVVTADHSHVLTIAGYPSRGNPILGLVDKDDGHAVDKLGLPYTTLGYANGPGYVGSGERLEHDTENGWYKPSEKIAGPRPNLGKLDTTGPNYMQEATVPLAVETHAGEDVAIYAGGPGAELFRGVLEQHLIYHIIADALGLDAQQR